MQLSRKKQNKTKDMLLHVCPFVGLHVLVITSMWFFYCYFKVQFSYYLQHIFGLEIIDSALHRKHCCSMQHTLSGTKSNKYGYGSGSIYSIVMFAKHMLCLNKLCQQSKCTQSQVACICNMEQRPSCRLCRSCFQSRCSSI